LLDDVPEQGDDPVAVKVRVTEPAVMSAVVRV
jgi:hypothetical protein